jgi:hypothetical protein
VSRVLDQRSGAAAGTTSTRDGGDWRDRAACTAADPDLFFAADEERANRRNPRVARAKAICTVCPVQSRMPPLGTRHTTNDTASGAASTKTNAPPGAAPPASPRH